jgi:hypothetical protein
MGEGARHILKTLLCPSWCPFALILDQLDAPRPEGILTPLVETPTFFGKFAVLTRCIQYRLLFRRDCNPQKNKILYTSNGMMHASQSSFLRVLIGKKLHETYHMLPVLCVWFPLSMARLENCQMAFRLRSRGRSKTR